MFSNGLAKTVALLGDEPIQLGLQRRNAGELSFEGLLHVIEGFLDTGETIRLVRNAAVPASQAGAEAFDALRP